MGSFSRDKKTDEWFCSDCFEKVSKKVVFSNYNYFGKNLVHRCGQGDVYE
jgi:hypothetical protein